MVGGKVVEDVDEEVGGVCPEVDGEATSESSPMEQKKLDNTGPSVIC